MDYISLHGRGASDGGVFGLAAPLQGCKCRRALSGIRRMEMGNPGDTRSVGQGILEMRIDYGPGYRIYYVNRGAQIVILLCGGDKRTQQRDIKRAQRLAETL
jgi:putative addiction module killer protein